jgi:predicted dehydrogenase
VRRGGEAVEAILVGCGAMSRTWLEAARRIDGLSIVGLVDIDEEQARARAAEFGLNGAAIGTSLDDLLKADAPDAVFDVVVPNARSAVALAALRSGCHVLTEKPLATSLEAARSIIDTAREAGLIHAVVQNRRYLPAIRRIRRLLDSGELGAPTSLHCDFFLAPHFGGFREEMEHVLLLDMAIHTFDAARAMTGLDARRVWCREWDPSGTWYRQGSSATAVFDLSNGGVFDYRGSWCADGARTSWEGDWRIVCERGSLTWDGFDAIQAESIAGAARDGLFDVPHAVEVPALDPSDRVGGHLGVIRDFVAAIRTGRPPETAGDDNLKSLEMVFAAIESAETGRPVDIEHVTEHDLERSAS